MASSKQNFLLENVYLALNVVIFIAFKKIPDGYTEFFLMHLGYDSMTL